MNVGTVRQYEVRKFGSTNQNPGICEIVDWVGWWVDGSKKLHTLPRGRWYMAPSKRGRSFLFCYLTRPRFAGPRLYIGVSPSIRENHLMYCQIHQGKSPDESLSIRENHLICRFVELLGKLFVNCFLGFYLSGHGTTSLCTSLSMSLCYTI